MDDASPLGEMQWRAYVSADTDHLRIYISGDLLDVFDAIADQLRDILHFNLLPAGIRDEVASLVQSNLARLGNPQFGADLHKRLREKGFPVEEDEELQRILLSAVQDMETETQAGAGEHVQEDESGTESDSHSTHENRGDSGEPKKRQTHRPRQSLTRDEVLATLPEFDEASFGRGSVVDLSNTSEWQNPTQQTDPRRRSDGGYHGGGDFRTVQAYREAYGARGEQWVVEQERRALRDAGRTDLAERVLHRSKTHEGSPWDIESFEKSDPHRPIYVEVKSTSETDNFAVEMSADQIRNALQPSRPYYLYRVVDVNTSKPSVYIYDFKEISKEIQVSATKVAVTLPRPKSP